MPVRRNQNWLPSIFNDFFDNDWMVKANATAPAINVFETAKEYKVELAAPGMTKEDFNVHIDEENNLVISMEKKTESNVMFNTPFSTWAPIFSLSTSSGRIMVCWNLVYENSRRK